MIKEYAEGKLIFTSNRFGQPSSYLEMKVLNFQLAHGKSS
jgi:hypothetical protein